MRRANLLTLRKFFNWKSIWYSEINYKHFAFRDIMITMYLTSIFKKLRFPTSSFFIKHFYMNYIFIYSDVYIPNLFRAFLYTQAFLSKYSQFLVGVKLFINSEYEYFVDSKYSYRHKVHKLFFKSPILFLRAFYKKVKYSFLGITRFNTLFFYKYHYLVYGQISKFHKIDNDALGEVCFMFFDSFSFFFSDISLYVYFLNGFFFFFIHYYTFFVDYIFLYAIRYSFFFNIQLLFFTYKNIFYLVYAKLLFNTSFSNKLFFLYYGSTLDRAFSYKHQFAYSNNKLLHGTSKYNYLLTIKKSFKVYNYNYKNFSGLSKLYFFFDFVFSIPFLLESLFLFNNIILLFTFMVFNLKHLTNTDVNDRLKTNVFLRLFKESNIFYLLYKILKSKFNKFNSFFFFWLLKYIWNVVYKELYESLFFYSIKKFDLPTHSFSLLYRILDSVSLLNVHEFTSYFRTFLFFKNNLFFFNTISMLYHYSYFDNYQWILYLKYNYFFEFFNTLNTSIELSLSTFINCGSSLNVNILFLPNLFLFWKPNISSAKMVCDYLYFKFKLRLNLNKVYSSVRKWQIRERSVAFFSFALRYRFGRLMRKHQYLFSRRLKKRIRSNYEFYNYFFSELSSIRTQVKGIRITCSGPPYKAKRKLRISYHIWAANFDLTGHMPLQTIDLAIDYFQSHVTLKRATLGLKVWLLFESYVKLK